MKDLYDFPVELQGCFSPSGKPVPGARSVVRTDTDEPLNAVSSKYKLVTHSELVDKARQFVGIFGTPKETFSLGQNGRKLLSTFQFVDKTQALQKNDKVGLRVMVQNSYNTSSSVIVKIGAIRLACMNGMVVADNVLEIKQRHTGDFQLEFPDPDRLWDVFCQNTNRWKELQRIELTESDYDSFVMKAVEEQIIQQAAEKTKTEGHSAWDLYNQFTYHITHESKAAEMGKFNRLARVDKWINEAFDLQKIA